MPKVTFKPSKLQLQENLLAYSETLDPPVDYDSPAALAKRLELPQRTVHGAMRAETNPYKVLDALAAAANLQPWQLLFPLRDKNMLLLIQALNEADHEGRQVFELAIKGVLLTNAEKRAEEQAKRDQAAS